MFDSPINYRLAQKRSNKSKTESFIHEYIYVFHVKNEKAGFKYIGKIKEYANNILTIEFYPKIQVDDKYKLLTNQFKFGYIAATVLNLMAEIQKNIGVSCFGILSASLINEKDNIYNKRYSIYIEILRRKVNEMIYSVMGVEENSYIFILPNDRVFEIENIILQYEKIFKETN